MHAMTRWTARLPRLAGTVTLTCTLLAGTPLAGVARLALAAPPTAAWTAPALPLAFEPNVGQAAPGSSFLAQAHGYSLLIGPTTMRIVLATGHTTVRLSFLDANALARVETRDRLPGEVNYLLGRDQRGWHTAIPTYARLQVRDLYPGIDLLYYAGRRGLEYDLLVHPGANPRRIRIATSGATLHTEGGDLIWRTAGGTLVLAAPTIYQQDIRTPLAGGYRLSAAGVLSFRLAPYNLRRTLVIDPFVKVIGTSGYNSIGGAGTAITVDGAGNTYVTGTGSGQFPTTPGAALTTLANQDVANSAIVVMKFDPAGKLLFSTYLGTVLGNGTTDLSSAGIAVDGAGNVYVTGSTDGTNFPLVHPLISYPPPDGSGGQAYRAFVAKLNPTGSRVLYSTYLGG
jgi:hypothetical protein